jgi:hypothetical protein
MLDGTYSGLANIQKHLRDATSHPLEIFIKAVALVKIELPLTACA